MHANSESPTVPTIAILGWEAGHEDTLAQLEELPGNIAHPKTFAFPVLYQRVPGAYYETVVVRPTAIVLRALIQAAQEAEAAGVKAITTSCGFNALFQRELAEAVSVPLFASSLIQVPTIHAMLSGDQQIGIITADRRHLTPAHLTAAGITRSMPICIAGIEHTEEFARVRDDPHARLDRDRLCREVVQVAEGLVAQNQQVGAILLECTDLPPFAAAIRRAVGLPVFDIVTLTNLVYEAVARDRWAGTG